MAFVVSQAETGLQVHGVGQPLGHFGAASRIVQLNDPGVRGGGQLENMRPVRCLVFEKGGLGFGVKPPCRVLLQHLPGGTGLLGSLNQRDAIQLQAGERGKQGDCVVVGGVRSAVRGHEFQA